MDAFSPWPPLIGGLMIGLASAILWIGNGRIAGISGLFGQLLPPLGTVWWRVTFLVAMIAGAVGAAAIVPALFEGFRPEAPQLVGTPLWIATAGLLVGLGTKIGNGCTSGHGVCGIARFSKRSFVNVGIFFAVAIATVAITGIV
ncbi:MAG: YeeE/YedE thiosulfate transporter family protein [Cucumibacter sp.]